MTCAHCGAETTKHEYIVFQIKKTIVLEKVGEQFFYDARVYFLCEYEGDRKFGTWVGSAIQLLDCDAITIFGDGHGYWIDQNHSRLFFCTRACAKSYAASHNSFLLRATDGAQITPQQNEFDEYALQHNHAHHVVLTREDEWSSAERELLDLLEAKLQHPDRLLALAGVMVDQGKSTLASRAIDKVLAEYPLWTAVQHCAPILCQLREFERIDLLFEQLAEAKCGRSNLPGEMKSAWALMIGTYNKEKAITLSAEAFEDDPSSSHIAGNYLMLLAMHDPDRAIDFFRNHSTCLNEDVGLFAAGQAFLAKGLLAEAEEHLRLSDLLLPEPMTKSFLAETLYRRGRYAEALGVAQAGISDLEQFRLRTASDFDGEVRNPSHYNFELKNQIRAQLLAVEGKSLMTVGEIENGRSRIRAAFDAFHGHAQQSPFFEDINSLVEGYATRTELHQRLALEQQRFVDLLSKKRKTDVTLERLNDVFAAIAATERDWQHSLQKVKDATDADFLAEYFADELHVFSVLLSRRERDRYDSVQIRLKSEFPSLPAAVQGQLANAEFLLDDHRDDTIPIFGAVIVEYSKAVETAANAVLFTPFSQNGLKASFRPFFDNRDGVARRIELTSGGKPRPLMMGEIAPALGARRNDWNEFLRSRSADRLGWVRNEFPKLVKQVKDQYRNGCAHSEAANRTVALELREYLWQSHLFAFLNEFAKR